MLRVPHAFLIGGLLFGLAAVCLPRPAIGQKPQSPNDSQSGILYGDKFAYTVVAPKGWIMDSEAGKREGVSVVFYRRGETWRSGDATMYVNVIGRDKGQTAQTVIADDIATFKKRHPKMKVSQDKTLETGDRRRAVTYLFKQVNKNASDERVSYVETPTVVFLITLTARTSSGYQRALADHTALVHSVAFLAPGAKIQRATGGQ